jgi:hypothetical protein
MDDLKVDLDLIEIADGGPVHVRQVFVAWLRDIALSRNGNLLAVGRPKAVLPIAGKACPRDLVL